MDKKKKQEDSSTTELSAEDLMAFKPLDFGGKAPMGFVRGGTPTTDSVNMYEREYQEAEQRRDAEDEARRLASMLTVMAWRSSVMASLLCARPISLWVRILAVLQS
jgi:hypothetical protein